jgi:hypothetical protein
VRQFVEAERDGADSLEPRAAVVARLGVRTQWRDAEAGVAVDQQVDLRGKQVAVKHLGHLLQKYDGGGGRVSNGRGQVAGSR